MPELPEVESLIRLVRPRVVGHTVTRCRVIHPIVVEPQLPKQFAHQLLGRSIEAIDRRGKYIVFTLDSLNIVFHLKLDGKFLWIPAAPPAGAHLDIVFELEHGQSLAFTEPRHLGRARVVPDGKLARFLPPLGPDPFDSSFTHEFLYRGLKSSLAPVKIWLMNQTRISGLGNIYAAEALFRAGIRPTRRAEGRPGRRSPATWRAR